jgi:glycogen operon protein
MVWLTPDGSEMTDEAWNATFVRSLGMLLAGELNEADERGQPVLGDTILVLLNAHSGKVPFTLPLLPPGRLWRRMFDTIHPQTTERVYKPGVRYPLQARTVAVFVCRT